MLSLLAAAEPTFDTAYAVSLLSRVAHTTCAATLLGGLIYLRFVLAPAAVASNDVCQVAFAGKRRAWALCVAFCSALLLASGIYNLILFTSRYENLPSLYHPLFGVKFLLSFGVMFIAALIAGKTNLAKRCQGNLIKWLNVAIVLALSVFVLGAVLRSFRDLPDARVAPVVEVEMTDVDVVEGIEVE